MPETLKTQVLTPNSTIKCVPDIIVINNCDHSNLNPERALASCSYFDISFIV